MIQFVGLEFGGNMPEYQIGFWRNSDHSDSILNEEAVTELSDLILQYMTEIDFKDLPPIIGQILDDFADQSGCLPDDLENRCFSSDYKCPVGRDLGVSTWKT